MSDSEKLHVRQQLNDLRHELIGLRELAPLSSQFTNWLVRLHGIVEGQFGSASSEMTQLRAVSTEFPPEFYDSILSRVEGSGFDEAAIESVRQIILRTVPQRIYLRRLDEYADLIASLQFGLEG